MVGVGDHDDLGDQGGPGVSREQAPLLVKMGILYSKLGDWDTATKLVQRAYFLSVENKEKDGILAGLAPLLTEVVG